MSEILSPREEPKLSIDESSANEEQCLVYEEFDKLAHDDPSLLANGLIAHSNNYTEEIGLSSAVAQHVVANHPRGRAAVEIWQRVLESNLERVTEFDPVTENEIITHPVFKDLQRRHLSGSMRQDQAEGLVRSIRLLRWGIYIGRLAASQPIGAQDPAA